MLQQELPIVSGNSHSCLLKPGGDEMNNPDLVPYNIELNQRREDKTFKMHDVHTLLKFTEIALEKYAHNMSLLLQFYILLISLLYTFYSISFVSWSVDYLRPLHFFSLLSFLM